MSINCYAQISSFTEPPEESNGVKIHPIEDDPEPNSDCPIGSGAPYRLEGFDDFLVTEWLKKKINVNIIKYTKDTSEGPKDRSLIGTLIDTALVMQAQEKFPKYNFLSEKIHCYRNVLNICDGLTCTYGVCNEVTAYTDGGDFTACVPLICRVPTIAITLIGCVSRDKRDPRKVGRFTAYRVETLAPGEKSNIGENCALISKDYGADATKKAEKQVDAEGNVLCTCYEHVKNIKFGEPIIKTEDDLNKILGAFLKGFASQKIDDAAIDILSGVRNPEDLYREELIGYV